MPDTNRPVAVLLPQESYYQSELSRGGLTPRTGEATACVMSACFCLLTVQQPVARSATPSRTHKQPDYRAS